MHVNVPGPIWLQAALRRSAIAPGTAACDVGRSPVATAQKDALRGKRHDVDRDMRVDPRKKMVEKNDGGSESPDACQGGIPFTSDFHTGE